MHWNDQEDRNRLKPALAPDEYIILRLKPKKSAYIGDKSLSMLPIAALWICVDYTAFKSIFMASQINWSDLLFMMIHMMPVWIWIGNLLTAIRQWENEEYFITNQRILIFRGLFTPSRDSLYLENLCTTQVRMDWVDRLFGSGDILLNYEKYRNRRSGIVLYDNQKSNGSGFFLSNLENPYEILDRIERLSLELKKVHMRNGMEGEE